MNPKPLLRKATHLLNNATDCLSEALEVLRDLQVPQYLLKGAEVEALIAACNRLNAVYRTDPRFAKETL